MSGMFTGKLVRLKAMEAERDAPLHARWGRDSHYQRLLDSDPARINSAKAIQKWLEKNLEKDSLESIEFMIYTLAEDLPIGFVGLGGFNFAHGDAWVGIGIGERAYWNKGFGTDAMQVLLNYAFNELNLHRLTLNVFEYNQRAVRSYEKAGFQVEGRMREFLNREGRRWDLIFMGILREEWQQLQQH